MPDTELCLGLPGAGENISRKRGFEQTVDLKLNLSTQEIASDRTDNSNADAKTDHSAKPPSKAQVVGWPPVGSFRKNVMADEKGSALVKVSMDGAPYLRKVDLKIYNSYQELSHALPKMFTIGKCELMSEKKLMDLPHSSDYAPTYQDKDGDWMLVGDVPWDSGEMQEQNLI